MSATIARIPTKAQYIAKLKTNLEAIEFNGRDAVARGMRAQADKLRIEWHKDRALLKRLENGATIDTCGKCGGYGKLSWTNFADGVCFDCHGVGWMISDPMTPEEEARVDAAYAAHQASRCPQCGHTYDETGACPFDCAGAGREVRHLYIEDEEALAATPAPYGMAPSTLHALDCYCDEGNTCHYCALAAATDMHEENRALMQAGLR